MTPARLLFEGTSHLVEAMDEADRYVRRAMANVGELRDNALRRTIESNLTKALDILQAELEEEGIRDAAAHPEDGDSPCADGGAGGVGTRRLGGLAGSTGRSAGMGSAGESVAAGARPR